MIRSLNTPLKSNDTRLVLCSNKAHTMSHHTNTNSQGTKQGVANPVLTKLKAALMIAFAGGAALSLHTNVIAQTTYVDQAALRANSGAYSAAPQLTPLKQRLSERQVRRDIDKMVDLHLRIDRLNTGAHPNMPYYQAQAYTWLEAARVEYLDNNETGWENTAFQNAHSLVSGLEQRVYPDIAQTAPKQRYFESAANKWNTGRNVLDRNLTALGRQSVLLAWAAYEEENDPNFYQNCVGSKFVEIGQPMYLAALPIITIAPPPLPVYVPPPAPPVELKIYDFPDSVHFALDEYYLSPESKSILDKVAAVMTQYPVLKINAFGHTDPRASKQYNMVLSERRAVIVRNYLLKEKGIDPSRVAIQNFGESQLLVTDVDARGHARNRRTQLFPQEGILVEGANFRITNEERDLQIEKPTDSREDNDKRRGVKPVRPFLPLPLSKPG